MSDAIDKAYICDVAAYETLFGDIEKGVGTPYLLQSLVKLLEM